MPWFVSKTTSSTLPTSAVVGFAVNNFILPKHVDCLEIFTQMNYNCGAAHEKWAKIVFSKGDVEITLREFLKFPLKSLMRIHRCFADESWHVFSDHLYVYIHQWPIPWIIGFCSNIFIVFLPNISAFHTLFESRSTTHKSCGLWKSLPLYLKKLAGTPIM